MTHFDDRKKSDERKTWNELKKMRPRTLAFDKMEIRYYDSVIRIGAVVAARVRAADDDYYAGAMEELEDYQVKAQVHRFHAYVLVLEDLPET